MIVPRDVYARPGSLAAYITGGGRGAVTFSIYVGNLPWRTTAEDLRALFEPYGQVENSRIVTDRESGRSRGFGFVDMAEDEAGQKAITELHNYDYGGRPLTVNEALSRQGAGGAPARGGPGEGPVGER
jgi:RNA recognition motif-containing protein